MRPTLPPLVCITLLALSSSCTRSDQTANQERADEAKAKARDDGERIKADAKKLASDAKRDAQSLDHKIDRALHS
jgi:phage terminase small subunit